MIAISILVELGIMGFAAHVLTAKHWPLKAKACAATLACFMGLLLYAEGQMIFWQ